MIDICKTLQKSSLQKRLHIATSIDNQQDVHGIAHNPVNHAVGFKKDLSIYSAICCMQNLYVDS